MRREDAQATAMRIPPKYSFALLSCTRPARLDGQETQELWRTYLEVNTKEDVLQDTGDDQQDVEQGSQTVEELQKSRMREFARTEIAQNSESLLFEKHFSSLAG